MEHGAVSQEKASPKHVFLHLFVIVVLYYSTVNFLILLFQYINYLIPDLLSQTDYYQMMFSSSLIRFAIASLIIVFPVFILTSRYLNKSYVKSPAIREMRIRKWLIYFTLFVAALVIIGDLVQIILTFLQGEMTTRFILKALSVLFVAAIIFYYYLRDLKQEKPVKSTKYFVWAIIVIVTASVVAGFFIIGSPKTERLRRFDLERVVRLQDIQGQIINYWRSKEYLPGKLADVEDKISGFVVSTDPENNTPFEYTVKGPETFELCATFNLVSEENVVNPSVETMPASKSGLESWKHGAGKTCFERTIDKELYPPYQKIK
ncbi:MAG: DUF5671 domain-containing protein [Candidatus Magasanikbacteria bacterium]|nr:DUF5671 domain-containing protein [Candidatus Magasanikbacteria bacterium]